MTERETLAALFEGKTPEQQKAPRAQLERGARYTGEGDARYLTVAAVEWTGQAWRQYHPRSGRSAR